MFSMAKAWIWLFDRNKSRVTIRNIDANAEMIGAVPIENKTENNRRSEENRKKNRRGEDKQFYLLAIERWIKGVMGKRQSY